MAPLLEAMVPLLKGMAVEEGRGRRTMGKVPPPDLDAAYTAEEQG